MISYTIIIYLIIAVIGNLIYFVGCNGNYPACGTISIVFFNLAVLCQLLPKLTSNHKDEKNQKNGQQLLCSIYLGIEIILAFICVSNDTSTTKAGIWQLVVLGIFLVSFLGMARANTKTNESIKEFKQNRSFPFLEANANLRCAMTQTASPQEREIFRSVLAQLTTIPSTSNDVLLDIDKEILLKANQLCAQCTPTIAGELTKLLDRRKTMMMIFNQ